MPCLTFPRYGEINKVQHKSVMFGAVQQNSSELLEISKQIQHGKDLLIKFDKILNRIPRYHDSLDVLTDSPNKLICQ